MSKLQRTIAVIVMAVIWFSGCKENKAPRVAPEQGAEIEPAQLCQNGGANYDAATNTCVCAPPQSWDGNRCFGEAAATKETCEGSGGSWAEEKCSCPEGQELKSGRCADSETSERNEQLLCKQAGGEWDEDESDCACDEEDLKWNGKACVDKNDVDTRRSDASLEDFCEEADGAWSDTDDYCYCSGSKVLFIDRCKTMKGRMSDDMCERAKYPGVWRRSRCVCGDDKVFIPNLGGCSEEVRDRDILKKICQDSLNDGDWDDPNKRCRCPDQKIWFESNCVEQQDLSSRDVCESDFNKGKWDADDKDCICPVGNLWINQTCKPLTDIPSKDACEAEKNGGRWDVALGTCICPGNTAWIPNLKLCDRSGVTPAQQLCIQSGGRPDGSNRCRCPSGFQTATLQEQGYQYCVKNGNDDDIPDWLLIILGILGG